MKQIKSSANCVSICPVIYFCLSHVLICSKFLTVQDKIADKARDIAGLVLGRQLSLPEGVKSEFQSYLVCNIEAVQEANGLISELDELLEAGFVGAEVQVVEGMIHQIDRIESHSDQRQIHLRHELYGLESTLSPIDAMFTYQIIDLIGPIGRWG